MTEHQFTPKFYYNTIGSHQPVLNINSGDSVITSTVDALGWDKNNHVTRRGNPMTGPFYVNGSEPGDTLAIHFDYIYPNRDWGFTANAISEDIVESKTVRQLHERDIDIKWNLDHPDGNTQISDANHALSDIQLPMKPFMGCFGLAPPLNQFISTDTSGNYGGNMDYGKFVAGTTAYFPVFVEGALIHLGDGHALQGDGEIVGTGIEVSMDVKFTVKLIKNKKIHWPRGESDTHIFTIGNARPIEKAIQHATTEMVDLLHEDYHLNIRSEEHTSELQ